MLREREWQRLEMLRRQAEREADDPDRLLDNPLNAASESDICSGRALNVLLDDLRKFTGKNALASTVLTGDVLLRINVTTKANQGNLGLLRNAGAFTWPEELKLPGILSTQERADIEARAQALLQQALRGNIARKELDKLRGILSAADQKLTKKRISEEISALQAQEGKRFLGYLDAACVALASGDAIPCFRFREWIGSGKTIQQVVEYMVQNGLRFAPALPGECQPYRIVHSALTFNREVNHLIVAGRERQ